MKRILGILALALALALATCSHCKQGCDDVISETKSHLDKAEQLSENDSLMESFAEYLEATKTQELIDYKTAWEVSIQPMFISPRQKASSTV